MGLERSPLLRLEGMFVAIIIQIVIFEAVYTFTLRQKLKKKQLVNQQIIFLQLS